MRERRQGSNDAEDSTKGPVLTTRESERRGVLMFNPFAGISLIREGFIKLRQQRAAQKEIKQAEVTE